MVTRLKLSRERSHWIEVSWYRRGHKGNFHGMFCGGVIHLDATPCFSKLVSGPLAISSLVLLDSGLVVGATRTQYFEYPPFFVPIAGIIV
jgi:hypothetical protein